MFSVHLLIAFNVSIEDGRKESGCYDWEPDCVVIKIWMVVSPKIKMKIKIRIKKT